MADCGQREHVSTTMLPMTTKSHGNVYFVEVSNKSNMTIARDDTPAIVHNQSDDDGTVDIKEVSGDRSRDVSGGGRR